MGRHAFLSASSSHRWLAFYDEEMEECVYSYAEYVLSLVEEAKNKCKAPVVLIEQRLDFSRYVGEWFGTGDCVIIADGTRYTKLFPAEKVSKVGGCCGGADTVFCSDERFQFQLL